MARQIFIVNAMIVDANGAFHTLDNYPKTFDSNNYQNDVDKARRRADGEFSECWATMCKRDDRQIQTVMLGTVDGFLLEKKSSGQFPAEEPDDEPDDEPVEE